MVVLVVVAFGVVVCRRPVGVKVGSSALWVGVWCKSGWWSGVEVVCMV